MTRLHPAQEVQRLDREVLNFAGTCQYLGLNEHAVRDLLTSGQIPARKVARRWLVHRRELDAFVRTPGAQQ